MGRQSGSTIPKELSSGKEEEPVIQLELSIVMTALAAILITLGYFIYISLVG